METSAVLLGLVVELGRRQIGLATATTCEEDGGAILKLQGGSLGLHLYGETTVVRRKDSATESISKWLIESMIFGWIRKGDKVG
jgi:hypothetical protein